MSMPRTACAAGARAGVEAFASAADGPFTLLAASKLTFPQPAADTGC